MEGQEIRRPLLQIPSSSRMKEYHQSDPESAEDRNAKDFAEMYNAAVRGDVIAAEEIFSRNAGMITQRDESGHTALHVAVERRHFEFIDTFLGRCARVVQNNYDKTPLCVAVETGDLSIVKLFTTGAKGRLYNSYFSHHAKDGLTPLTRAVRLGNFAMAAHMYESRKCFLDKDDVVDLFFSCITSGFLGLCLVILEDQVRNEINWDCERRLPNEETALHMLAKSVSLFSKTESKVQALILLKKLVIQLSTHSSSAIVDIVQRPTNFIIDAAEAGNHKFLDVILERQPDLFWEIEKECFFFDIGVTKHNLEIIKLIHKIHVPTTSLILGEDEEGNNILHRASGLPCDYILGDIGQLRRELLFFEEMEKIAGPALSNQRNRNNKTPMELFTREHQSWLIEAEKSMKTKVAWCLGVSTLSLSLLFGSTSEPSSTRTGMFLAEILPPVLRGTTMISGSISISIFISLLMVSYQLSDFKRALHLKFGIGFVSLVISMVSMMIYFCDILFLVYHGDYGPLLYHTDDVLRVVAFNIAALFSMVILFIHIICPRFHAIFRPALL